MKMYKIADKSDQNSRKIANLEKELKDLRKDHRKLESEFKKSKKDIDNHKGILKDLNIGKRLFYQERTVFNSLQRKIEEFERVKKEWVRYKDNIDDKIRKEINKKERASVSLKK
jgi:septal ring factor EnvC (AmiA/AmiB activator)